ncbi:hypothetical protein SAMN05216490_4690 [Mucilaginibacter mallensis]|uniref:Cupin domain-containing protein n=1 Tax=Mucilaginibacter mallensis TaxID=652787 RepID=A0A1H2C7C3_MUCMA|nr:cupin domain-containing protein [Mucilaginibacter mallensis]SDT66259.1 hypothetical protein SAMN05216490_4690 [Mucilaginibacter mallensis]
MNDKFKPNSCTFERGIERINHAIVATNFKRSLKEKISTSKDPDIQELLTSLYVDNVPDNFKKWQLPFYLDRSQFYISTGISGAFVPEHSHNDGDGLRYIVSGSIEYNGKVLSAGDWMYIPKGVKYSFTVGKLGATMFYCYQCCCA